MLNNPTMTPLKQTPLYRDHVELGAKMVDFGGWDLPVQYEGILAEYAATRQSVTVFDVSHMGEFIIEGDALTSGLDRIVTMPIVDMPLKTCRYGMILNETGGVIDDLIVFRVERDNWFIVVNAATAEKDAAHFQKHLTAAAKFTDVSAQTGKLDLQGPRSREILKKFVSGAEKLDYYSFGFFDLLRENVLISRTGYTGELGYEIFFPWDKTPDLWRALLQSGDVKPAGLGARDILRLEMGYSLYGHELSEAINPLEAGLTKFVHFDKSFIGKDALLALKSSGMTRRIVGIVSEDKRSPRAGQKLFSGEPEAGVVTSGSFSPHCQRGIGLGFVPAALSVGEKIFFGDAGRKFPAQIASRFFYKTGSIKS
ncbi:MAG: glycine cleavage system aminomethyltransferase GcvT [Candidatus Omnitrophica bacterium]|nr:glycine cleavage system aminomethyltransferase GcvT [Candidatus Omnitrophota bacterium]